MKSAAVLSGVMGSLILAGVAASGCGQAHEYCDLKCDCELCNDRKYDECVIDKDGDIDVAAAYDCDVEYSDYLTCVMDKANCSHNHWGVDANDCDNEIGDYNDCVRHATDLNGDVSSSSNGSSSGSDACLCTCTCESGVTGTACNGVGCCSGQCQSQCQSDGLGNLVTPDEYCGGA